MGPRALWVLCSPLVTQRSPTAPLTPQTLANLKPVRDKSISDPVVGAAGSYHQPLNIHLARSRLTRRFHVISTQDYARFSTARCKSMQQMELKDYFRQRHKFDIFRFSSVWLGRREREREALISLDLGSKSSLFTGGGD